VKGTEVCGTVDGSTPTDCTVVLDSKLPQMDGRLGCWTHDMLEAEDQQ
jgi:hypothetical protein